MAIWKRTVLDVSDARKLLGKAWLYTGSGLEYHVYSKRIDKHETSYEDYRSDLVVEESQSLIPGSEILDKHIWPTDLDVKIYADSFYANEHGEVINPLVGFPIKHLVQATNYPFHNPDRVVAIPIRYTPNNSYEHIISPNRPDSVLFVET